MPSEPVRARGPPITRPEPSPRGPQAQKKKKERDRQKKAPVLFQATLLRTLCRILPFPCQACLFLKSIRHFLSTVSLSQRLTSSTSKHIANSIHLELRFSRPVFLSQKRLRESLARLPRLFKKVRKPLTLSLLISFPIAARLFRRDAEPWPQLVRLRQMVAAQFLTLVDSQPPLRSVVACE